MARTLRIEFSPKGMPFCGKSGNEHHFVLARKENRLILDEHTWWVCTRCGAVIRA